jgi:pentatricopeptide repeat protein
MKRYPGKKSTTASIQQVIWDLAEYPYQFREILYDIEECGKTRIIKCLSKQGFHDLAIAIFEEYQPLDTKFLNVGLQAYGLAGRTDDMIDLFYENKAMCDNVTYSTLITYLGRNSGAASKIFDDIDPEVMDVVICTSMMFHLIKRRKFKEAEDIFASMNQGFLVKDVFDQTTADPDLAEDLKQCGIISVPKHKNVSHIVPNNVCYRALFTVYARTKEWKKSILLLHHLILNGCDVEDKFVELVQSSHGPRNHIASHVIQMLVQFCN